MKNMLKRVTVLTIIIIFIVFIYSSLQNHKIYIGNINILNAWKKEFSYLDNDSITSNRKKLDIKKLVSFQHNGLILNKGTTITPNNTKTETVSTNKSKPQAKDPIVYIYNTHQTEKYSSTESDLYNIIPTVMTTSYMLKEQLEKYEIYSIVEESSVNNVLNKNKWRYAYSYKVTRTFLEEASKKNPSLKFYIDVHRDSVSKKITTVEINGKTYAKIMLLLGLENKKYNDNLKMIEYINNEVNKRYPGLSRGIYKKSGPGVNGVYNQDFSKNCILIEFGGQYNTLNEVYNTVEVVAKILSEYIGDYNEDW